jgi:putative addiction module component (TIGR02574 family)
MDKESVLKAVSTWPEADRIELIGQLWNGLTAAGYVPMPSPEQLAELERRAAELDANPEIGLTWEEIRGRVIDSRRGLGLAEKQVADLERRIADSNAHPTTTSLWSG